MHEETGLSIAVGAPCLINEFHNPADGFHQVDLFFRCTITAGRLSETWEDPEEVMHSRRFFSQSELASIRLKPDSLPRVAFSDGMHYDPLEVLVLE